MNDFIIYERGEVKIYVCGPAKEKHKKLPIYMIRRDDKTGYADLLGIISFNPRWRQFTTKFESGTQWSSGCKRRICDFEDIINAKWRVSLKS